MDVPRIAVVGAGAFGRNHLRIIHQSEHASLAGIFDVEAMRAREAAATYGCRIFGSLEDLARAADGAVVATPTSTHSEIGCALMELGIDVLVEKPIAHSIPAAAALVETAARTGRILEIGHLERFNPAVIALNSVITKPLFFEIHRLSEFTPRSLDVDVVLDLMIHDIDIVLTLTGDTPEEIRAAGISILTPKVDIANVRLQFPGGCVANLTASRVSTERVRKLRVFQPHEYISLDYSRKDVVRFRVKPPMAIDFAALPVTKDEPLRLELEDFFQSMISRELPRVTGRHGLAALEAACAILDKIELHSHRVASALAESGF
ncbi:MAG: Gfo/Idh/MocA family oxidoreductase [Bryobacterales bacterium]|nr:Gfo/Idh/MocA family oxidoreductase [Bryobacterales bacterium]MBV9398556.1 Gfo/Idh/MocA family oxidoreductase [Bryobacterales bacterium]